MRRADGGDCGKGLAGVVAERFEHVVLHTIIVDDLDYTPLLALPRLKSVRVMNARGMTPTLEQLKAALPWSG